MFLKVLAVVGRSTLVYIVKNAVVSLFLLTKLKQK